MPDLLNNKQLEAKTDKKDIQPLKKKSTLWWRSLLVLFILVFLLSLGFLTKVVLAINSTNEESGKRVSFFEQIKHLLINPDKDFKGIEQDRINILLAGIGGAGHQGAYLADTIIVASLKPSTNEVATLSIPRDLYTDIPEFGWRKINNALAFGQTSDYPGGGEALLSEVVQEVTGLTIHYYARIDFAGFRKIIDDLGGIDVYVETGFTDYEYPDYNYGYQTISFSQGWEHMNGERALQFARSRHGSSGEGSDFARSKRQQKIILAIKEKFFSLSTLVNPNRILSALDDLGEHNKTNLQIWEIVKLAQMIEDINKDSFITKVLNTSPEGLLYSDTTIDGAYILKPVSGNYEDIHYLAENIFNSGFISRENAHIEIQNSTSVTGLASKTAERLEDMGYNVIQVGNTASEEIYEQTTIYDLSGGRQPYTIVSLKNMLNASLSSNLPAYMTSGDIDYDSLDPAKSNINIKPSQSDTDILIIIGTDLIEANGN